MSSNRPSYGMSKTGSVNTQGWHVVDIRLEMVSL